MRLLVVGRLERTARQRREDGDGARAPRSAHVESIEAATHALRAGQGADLLMVDYDLDIAGLIAAIEAERIRVPVVACGVGADASRAADAIRAGAKEFIPLPPDAELIAAVLAAVADDDRPMVSATRPCSAVISLADQVAASDASILITGESGIGKEVIARYVHRKSRARRQALHLRQLRRHPREPAGIRAVRPREGRLHRRHRPPHRQVRGSRRRHPAARRNLRDGRAACRPSCCAPSRSARSTASAARKPVQGRHPHPRHLQPRPGPGGEATAPSAKTCSTA